MQKELFFLIGAALLFSTQFMFTKRYQLRAGSQATSAFFYNSIAPAAVLLILLAYNRFHLTVSTLAILLAFASAVCANLCCMCSLRAYSLGGISNASIFTLGGSTLLPILYGAFFSVTRDKFNWEKIVAIVLILAAIVVRTDRRERPSLGALVFFFGVFFMNGLSATIMAIFNDHAGNVGSVDYMILYLIASISVGAVFFSGISLIRRECPPFRTLGKAAPWAFLGGLMNGLGNLMQILALSKLNDSSLSFPIITGGCIFLSALFGLIFYREKPSAMGWVSVGLAVAGTIFMFFA